MPLGAFKAALMGTAGVSTGDVVLLSSQTASNSASITFSSGITSTYGEYIFKFYVVGPATDQVSFTFGVNATDGADYNDSAITSTAFRAYHQESGDATALTYEADNDQAQGTAYQNLSYYLGNAADECVAGTLHLFNPSNTTYVKHFYSQLVVQDGSSDSTQQHTFRAGYINDTTAIDDIQFKMSSGNFDGTIKLWGVK